MTGRFGAALALVTAAARRDCRCEDLALARRAPVPRRVVVPAAFASRNLSSQVALLKVPETGSSTAANVFAELAAKFKRPAWVSMRPGEFERVVAAPARTAPKWALGHRGWGPWLRDHFDERVVDLATTARAPAEASLLVLAMLAPRVARVREAASPLSGAAAGRWSTARLKPVR